MTLKECIQWLALKHGSLRGLARDTGLDVSYLSRLMSGEKYNPSEDTLKRIGISRKVEYILNKSQIEKTLDEAKKGGERR